jgi:hypothetical protein
MCSGTESDPVVIFDVVQRPALTRTHSDLKRSLHAHNHVEKFAVEAPVRNRTGNSGAYNRQFVPRVLRKSPVNTVACHTQKVALRKELAFL